MKPAFLFDHFCISSEDLNKSTEWYKNIFDFAEERRFENKELNIKAVILKLDKFTLEIIEPAGSQNQIAVKKPLKEHLNKLGANHLALSVADLDAAFEWCMENNVEIVNSIYENRFFFCKDLDGTLIEVKKQKQQ